MDTKTKKLVTVLAVAFLVLAVGFALLRWVVKPVGMFGIKGVTIEVVSPNGSETFSIKTDAEFLAEALVEEGIVVDNQGDYGLYILTANGYTADDANQEWWCLTKGGEVHMLGASETPLADGDRYELTLTVGYDF